jgi:hypothetical protein
MLWPENESFCGRLAVFPRRITARSARFAREQLVEPGAQGEEVAPGLALAFKINASVTKKLDGVVIFLIMA